MIARASCPWRAATPGSTKVGELGGCRLEDGEGAAHKARMDQRHCVAGRGPDRRGHVTGLPVQLHRPHQERIGLLAVPGMRGGHPGLLEQARPRRPDR